MMKPVIAVVSVSSHEERVAVMTPLVIAFDALVAGGLALTFRKT